LTVNAVNRKNCQQRKEKEKTANELSAFPRLFTGKSEKDETFPPKREENIKNSVIG
jgi:hypothetical protein